MTIKKNKSKKLKNKENSSKQVKKPYKKLSKEEYAKALQHPKWQRKRLKIMERDKWRCKDCGNTEAQLHVHHLHYSCKFPWQELNTNLITLCNSCHAKAHKLVKR